VPFPERTKFRRASISRPEIKFIRGYETWDVHGDEEDSRRGLPRYHTGRWRH